MRLNLIGAQVMNFIEQLKQMSFKRMALSVC